VPGLVRVLLLATMIGASPAMIATMALAENEQTSTQKATAGQPRETTSQEAPVPAPRNDEQTDPRRWWHLQWLGNLQDGAPLTAALLVIIVLLLLLTGLPVVATWYVTRRAFAKRIDRVETAARNAFGKEALTLDHIVQEAQEWDEQRLADLANENENLSRENRQYQEQNKTLAQQLAIVQNAQPKEADGPDARLANAGRTAIKEARACFDRLEADPDFKSLDGTLNVGDALGAADSLLEKVAKGDAGAAALTAALRAGELDTVLTLAGFLDVYYPTQDDWYAAGRAVTAIEALIRSILTHEQVEIYGVRPLSRLRSPREGAAPHDRRNIQEIERVRRAVTDQAPFVSGDDLLVIDCSAPGYIIAGIESTPPQLSLYNPVTWSN
jgi:hypothetical protein